MIMPVSAGWPAGCGKNEERQMTKCSVAINCKQLESERIIHQHLSG